jgi:hypothetical protein
MINAVTSAPHAPALTTAPKAAPSTQAAAKPQSATPNDTVQISSAAAQALKEAIENPAQTAREAASGDQVAKRLLAKEAADKLV